MRRVECTDQETWVLEQVEKGEIADLMEQFGKDEDQRRLRAKFLEALLTDDIEGFKPHRRGIRIWHAVVAEPLDLENAKISHFVEMFSCIFQAKVNGRDSRWQKVVDLGFSEFLGEVDFHRLRAASGFLCWWAVFKGPVDFGSADIGGQFNANGLEFQSKTEKINFNGLKVGQDALFRWAVFQGPVDFAEADVGGQFAAGGAEFQSKTEKINFNGLKVARDALFRWAVFQGPVDFAEADVGGQFNANGLEFQSKTEKINFNGLKVGQDAFFRGAVFHGPVDFAGADIGEHFAAQEAEFLSESETANFNSLKVGKSAFFQGAVFHGPVDFAGADIGRQFAADNAQVLSETETAIFNSLSVGQDAFFRGAVFQGPVDFQGIAVEGNFFLYPLKLEKDGKRPTEFKGSVTFAGAAIGGQFAADNARFLSENATAIFNGLKVGQSAFFNGAVFQGQVDFGSADIGGSLAVIEARFENPQEAIFSGLRVGSHAFFSRAAFKGKVALNHAHLLDLVLGGKPIPELNLERSRIDRELRITDMVVEDSTGTVKGLEEPQKKGISVLKARYLTVRGPVILKKVTFTEEVDLRDAHLQTITLEEVTWPKEKNNIQLEGLTYRNIDAGPGAMDPQKLLDWLEGSRFHTQPYFELESYFHRHGNQEWADKVFLALKKRQCREPRRRWGATLWTWFLIGLVGYGRKPLRALFPIAGLILLGYLFFGDASRMIPLHTCDQAVYTNPAMAKKSADYSEEDKVFEQKGQEHYNWLWYTLDLMLPIDLEMDKFYVPKDRWARVYYHVLPLAGWVIIAALAVSLTGLLEIKRDIGER